MIKTSKQLDHGGMGKPATNKNVYSLHQTIFSLVLLAIFTVLAKGAEKPPPLKLAVIAPVMEWDDPELIREYSEWLEGHYNLRVTWIQPEHPVQSDDKEDRRNYYRNPPPIKGLKNARAADVIYTALTHVALNEADTLEYLNLLATKPVVCGRRAHGSLVFQTQKHTDYFGKGMKDGWAWEIFGCVMGGHHRGKETLSFGPKAAGHPIIDGLDEVLTKKLTDRGYRFKKIADDVTVLIVTTDDEPQVWCRTRPGTDQRVFYFVHDPDDLQQHEVVRRMVARAIFWVAGKNHRNYEDG